MKTNSISAGLAVHARTIATTRHLILRRAWLWTGFLAFATIAFRPQPAQAAVTEAWVQRYGSEVGSQDSAHNVVTDAAGNVIVAGTTEDNQAGGGSDMLVIKYSGAGVPLWTNRYDGPGNSDHRATAVAVDASGNVFVSESSGYSDVSGGNYYESATIAYSGAGVPLWTNRYDGPDGYDHATAVAVAGNGNVVVLGTSATIAYSGAGVPLWTNRYNGSATAMAVAASGNVFVTGNESATIAYSGAGVPLWTNRYNGSGNGGDNGDYAVAVAVAGNGNVVVTGSSGEFLSSSAHAPDYATIAYSGAGVPLWTNRYNGPGKSMDIATAMAVDGSGNVFVTGFSVGSGGDPEYATIAYSSAGVRLWTKRYSSSPPNGAISRAVAVDGSGNVFVTGVSADSGGNEYATIAYSGAGVTLWTKRYNANVSYELAMAMAVDASGNVVVTGGSDGDFYTAKYAAADGALLWEKRYNGPANLNDSASAVAVDDSGNIVVTGRVDSYNSDEYHHIVGGYYTAKYAAADGATLWEKRFNVDLRYAGLTDRIFPSLALGPNGMIVVSGSSSGDYATVVYREVPTVSIDLVPTGIRLRFTGVPGRSYHIERAASVTGPWSPINTQTAPASGFLEYLDANSPAAAAFYRTSEP